MPGATRRVHGVVVVVALLTGFGQGRSAAQEPAERLEASEVASRFGSAVVQLQARAADGTLKSGSGFFVSPEGVIATSLHILDGAESLAVVVDGRRIDAVAIRSFDVQRDLAVVQIDEEPASVVEPGETSTLRPGDRLFVIHNPLGLTGTISQGILSAVREPSSGDAGEPAALLSALPQIRLLQLGAAVAPGSSGSPVFDVFGQVVGMVTGGIAQGALDLNFAVPIDELIPYLEVDEGLTLASLREWVARQRQEMVEPHLNDARYYLDAGDWASAERALARALGIFPGSGEALLMLAEMLERLGRFDEAEETLRSAAAANPESAAAWVGLGRVLMSRGPEHVLEAAGAFRKARELDPWRADAAYGLGEAYLALGQAGDALAAWQEAVELDRDLVEAHLALGRLYTLLKDFDAAEKAFKDALWVDRDIAAAHLGLSVVYKAMGDPERSERHWRRFVDLGGEVP